jgi:multisubunit Na+/H+ antiporter MnhE subunit
VIRSAFKRWNSSYRDLPFGWRFIALFTGLIGGRIAAAIFGIDLHPLSVGDALGYFAVLTACIVLAQVITVRVWRSHFR